jgi:hypothetical protein
MSTLRFKRATEHCRLPLNVYGSAGSKSPSFKDIPNAPTTYGTA